MAKLYFRYGAMNSGKTTALIQVAYNYEERGMRVLLVNYPGINDRASCFTGNDLTAGTTASSLPQRV